MTNFTCVQHDTDQTSVCMLTEYTLKNRKCLLKATRSGSYIGCVSESGDFKNVMNSKCFQLFSFNTYENNVYIKAFRFFTFNTLKTKVLLPENNIIQKTTIPL